MIAFFPSRRIALSLWDIDIYWYGLMYLTAFVLGMWLLPRLQKYRDLSLDAKQRDRLLMAIVLGVIVGGRLGYVFFWGGMQYLQEPLRIFAVWEGGMSSHGGMIGVILAVLLFCKREHVSPWKIADVLMPAVAIGLALGRVGNFINMEIVGTLTNVPWAVDFPTAPGPRHPVQIYSVIKDLLIATITYRHLIRMPYISGRTFALFMMAYGVARFTVEFWRDQSLYGYIDILGLELSRGQVLTIPVFFAGIMLWVWRGKKSVREA